MAVRIWGCELRGVRIVVLIALGLALAYAGRRCIWLLIGLAALWLGFQLVGWILPNQDATFHF